jgi:pimeloyl-ACP methyl ester carboxylesterase
MAYSSPFHLVFVHGNSSSDKVFEKQAAYFEKRTIITLPGHGDSIPSKEPYRDYSIDSMKKTILNQCEALENCVLLGNSLGGHLAIEIAPDLANLKALILFAAPPLKKPLNIESAFKPVEALASYFQSSYDEAVLRKNLSVAMYGNAHSELLIQDFMRTDPIFREVWTKDATINMALTDEADIIENLSVPVYVIHGKQDPSTNIEYIRSLKGITRIYEIDECGHYPSVEQPEKFNAIVEEILEKGILIKAD